MQVLLSDSQVTNRPRMSKSRAVPPPLLSRSSISSDETPLQTPSFTPNAPAEYITKADLSLKELEKDAVKAEKASDLDLDLPISTLLREGTKRAHVQAENSAGAEALVKGELPLEEYIKWLAVLWRVYDALELALSTHSSNPVLQGIYDPTLLERGPALAADITHLLTLLPADTTTTSTAPAPSESTPLPPFPLPTFLAPVFSDPAPALKNFIQHIHHLSTSSGQAPLLLAHAYVRYLGDLSGGQIIGGRIKRAYGLKEQQGTAFYDFSSKGSRSGFESDPSFEGGKKRLMDIKDWYRRGMDDGVGEDRDLKERLVAEANLSFALNTSLFALVPPPPAKSSAGTKGAAPPAFRTADELRGQLDGNFGTIPMMFFAFGVSLLVSKFLLPQIYDMMGL